MSLSGSSSSSLPPPQSPKIVAHSTVFDFSEEDDESDASPASFGDTLVVVQRAIFVDHILSPSIPRGLTSTEESKTWRHYTGNLTAAEKKEIAYFFQKKETQFKVIMKGAMLVNIVIRASGIFKNHSHAIVNQIEMDRALEVKRGIDLCISLFGGKGYCEAYAGLQSKAEYREGYKVGHANIIASGELVKQGFSNVVVVAMPKRSDHEKDKEKAEDAVYSCYYNSLVIANQNEQRSIAFPIIGSKWQDQRIAQISLKAIYDFIHAYPMSMLETISIDFCTLDKARLLAYFFALKSKQT